MPPAPRRSLIPILRRRNKRGEAEASLLLFPRGIPFEGTPDGGWTGGASGDAVGAVINRPGDSAPAGGRFHGGCAPHSLFVLYKKRMRRARWKRKNRFIALRHVRASARRGSAYRCLLRFCLAFGHAWVFCEVDTAVPCRMVRPRRGAKPHSVCFSFTVSRCGAPSISVTSVPLVPPSARSASLRAGGAGVGEGE